MRMTRETSSQNMYKSATSLSSLSPEEVQKLSTTCEKLYEDTEYLKRVLKPQRLRFVQYLLEHGEISEDQIDQLD